MSVVLSSGISASSEWTSLNKLGPLALIVLSHVGLLYVLNSGLPSHTALAVSTPREVFATFIQPEPAPTPVPETPKPVVSKPKAVPVVKKTPKPLPKPVVPDSAPTPQQEVEETPIQAPPSFEPPAAAAPSAAPVAATPAPPKVVSGVEYIRKPNPTYPPIAKRMSEEGKVVLRILVNEKGRPERVEIQTSSGSARLDEAAKQAALDALFKPYMENGKPVAVYAIVPIDFSIQ